MTTRADLVGVLVIVALGAPVALLAPEVPVVRAALGIPLLLFLPGYALLAALYPRRGDLELLGRLALTPLLSLAVVALLALAVNYLPGGNDRANVVLVVVVTVVALTAIAWLRRGRIVPRSESLAVSLSFMRWRPDGKLAGLSAAVLAAVLIGIGAAAVVLLPRAPDEERYTEFYITGPDGRVESLPAQVISGEQLRLTVGTANREGAPVAYRIEVRTDDASERLTLGSFTLEPGQRLERDIGLALRTAGDDRTVRVLLYREQDEQPYRLLHLVLDVRERAG